MLIKFAINCNGNYNVWEKLPTSKLWPHAINYFSVVDACDLMFDP